MKEKVIDKTLKDDLLRMEEIKGNKYFRLLTKVLTNLGVRISRHGGTYPEYLHVKYRLCSLIYGSGSGFEIRRQV